jgi:hypothetical protein
MKHLEKFNIFESNWITGKISEFDLDENDIKDYLSYIIDEYDTEVLITKGFWNYDFSFLNKKTDLSNFKYYPGYHILLKTNIRLNNIDTFINYNKLLLNALNSLKLNYHCKISNSNIYNFTLICLDTTQELEFVDRKNIYGNIILDKISKIHKICSVLNSEELSKVYVKEKSGTSAERLEEILMKIFAKLINDNEIKITKMAMKVGKDSKGDYYLVDRGDYAYNRIGYKNVFLIERI